MRDNLMAFIEMSCITTSLSSRQSKINQDYLVTSRNLLVTLTRVQQYEGTCNIELQSTPQLLPLCVANSHCASRHTLVYGEGGW